MTADPSTRTHPENHTGSVSTAVVSERLAEHGLRLPPAWQVPAGDGTSRISASLVRRVGNRLYLSGHVPTDEEGGVCGPYGLVGDVVGLETAQRAAVRTLLSLLASVDKAVGDLSAVKAWCVLRCMANSAAGFTDFPTVFNPASALLADVFGNEIGGHARVAVGVAGLPWNLPVEIEAELELHDPS